VTAVRDGPDAPKVTPPPAVAGREPALSLASTDPAASASFQYATGVRPSVTRKPYVVEALRRPDLSTDCTLRL
jgi:hypothetical protein